MSTALRQRMHQDLQLAGLAEGTQTAYLRVVRQLAAHFHKPPDQITEHELREYLLYLKNERKYQPSSLKIAASGIIFFYTHTAPRTWPTLQKIRFPRPDTLPDVLSIAEVRRLIDAVRTPHNKGKETGTQLVLTLNCGIGGGEGNWDATTSIDAQLSMGSDLFSSYFGLTRQLSNNFRIGLTPWK